MAGVGPALPPHLLRERENSGNSVSKISQSEGSEGANAADEVENNESDDDYGPSLPPELAASRSQFTLPKISPSGSIHKRHAVGPSFPTGLLPEDSDDETIGPNPMTATGYRDALAEGVNEFLEQEARRQKETEGKGKSQVLKREEWMLAPPSASDLLVSLDPKKLRTTKKAFSAATSTSRDTTIDNTLWTETPMERQKRLAEEVSGKRKRATNTEPELTLEQEAEKRRRLEEDENIRKKVQNYNETSRGKSLVAMHGEKTKVRDAAEDSPKIWDHTRDMSTGGMPLSDKGRREMINQARSLGDRFGSGKSGSFL